MTKMTLLQNMTIFFSEREREIGFNWFKHLMGEDSDLDQESILTFFIDKILQLDTSSLTQSAIDCFSSFFTHIIQLKPAAHNRFKVNPTQEGLNYLWAALCSCDELIAPSIISIIQHHHHHLYHLNGDGNVNHIEFFDECIQGGVQNFDRRIFRACILTFTRARIILTHNLSVQCAMKFVVQLILSTGESILISF